MNFSVKKCAFGIILFLWSVNMVFSIENYKSGGRSLALSNAFVSFTDIWSGFHNQAGLAGIKTLSAGMFYESRFFIDELSIAAGTVILPSRSGNFGLSFYQFGKKSHKENKIGLSYSLQLSEKLSTGIQIDYLSRILPENERPKGFATFEAGIIYKPAEKLFLGVHIFNPVNGSIETIFGKEKPGVVYRLGGHYFFDELLVLTFETEKNNQNALLYKSGIEFSPGKNLFLRLGVSGKPVNYTSGIGYRTGKITTDIALSYHGNLGLSPSISIQFEL